MPTLLTEVQLALSIHAHRRTRGLLEGEYGSIHKGRSLDFDDLRAYVPGDDVKDLDWKATSRSPYPLVKRFVAVRKHTVLLVVGTGRGMSAMASPTATKRDVAVLAAGVLGLIAVRHGDLVGLVAGDASGRRYVRPAGSTRHLEQLLRTVDARIDVTAPPTDVRSTLRWIVRAIPTRTILLLVDDTPDLGLRAADDDGDGDQALLRRLAAQHEVLRVRVGDLAATSAAIAGRAAYDVGSGAAVSRYLRRDRVLAAEADAAAAALDHDGARALQRLGIASVTVADPAGVVPAVLSLLERHRRARV